MKIAAPQPHDPGREPAFVAPQSHPAALQAAREARKRITIVYAVAGMCAAALITLGTAADYTGGITPFRLFSFLAVIAWPVLLISREIAGHNARNWRAAVAGYVVLLFVLGAVMNSLNKDLRIWDVGVLWLLMNALPTGIVYVLANRKARTTGPLIFSLAVIAMSGMWGLVHIAATKVAVGGVISTVTRWIGLSPEIAALTVFPFGLLSTVPLLLLALRAVARAYQRQKFSEMSLAITSTWVMFAAMHAIVMMGDRTIGTAIFWVIAAFPCYFLLKAAAFRLITRPASGPSLLVLRAFALGRETERMFDGVSGLWRFIGPVRLIGGVDLASRLIQPSTLLRFLARKLATVFVGSPDQLRERLANLQDGPDPDGRFRTSEFFCYDNTWEITVRHLALRSSVIVMDFRTFRQTKERSGCEKEIRDLLPIIPAQRMAIIVDGKTDRGYLSQVINEVWERLPPSSPNYRMSKDSLRSVEFDARDPRAIDTVCEAVFALASGGPDTASAAEFAN